MFTSPGEIAFSVFSFPVHWYGIIMALAISTGLFTVSLIRKNYYPDISKDFIIDLSFILIIFGIIGARLYYVFLDYNYYVKYPQEILAIWHGGLSIHGAIIAAILAGAFYIKLKNYNFLLLADLFTYGLIIGQAIGRWGNFFNSEAFGTPANIPWKLYIPVNHRPLMFYNIDYFHPAFLYESLLNIIIFLILFFIIRKISAGKEGVIFFSYMIMYSSIRIFTESIRIDSIASLWGIPIAQIISLIFFIIGLIGLILICRKKTC